MNALSIKSANIYCDMENIYPGEVSAGAVSRTAVALSFLLFAAPVLALAPVVSAQAGIFPEINISCDDPPDMDVSPGASRNVVSNCILENPSMHPEEVEITVQSGGFAYASPGSMTVPADSEESFEVTFRGDLAHDSGSYVANITVQVTQASGVDVTLITSPESTEVTIVVAEFTSCEHDLGQGGGTLGAGEIITFSTSISCTSNEDSSFKYIARMISDSGDSSWPSGFSDQSAPCNIQVQSGGSSTNCQFQILTPSNLGETWDGCIVVLEEGGSVPKSCPTTNSIDVKVEPKSIGIGTIDLIGNGSIFGDYSEEAPVIVGGVAVVLVLTIVVFVIRRRRRSFDD